MAFPTTLPSYTITTGSETLNTAAGGTGLSGLLNAFEVDITALGTKIGTGSSTPTSNTVLIGNGVGTSTWSNTVSGLTLLSPTLTTPTIASFVNAQHSHSNTTGGGTLGANAMPNLSFATQSLANPYKFRARRVTALTLGGSTFQKVVFDTEDFDTNSNFATGTYTAPVAGFYQFNARISASASTQILVALYKNGTVYQRGSHNLTAAGVSGVIYSDLVQASQNDTFDIYVFYDGSGGVEVAAGSQSYFSGYLVSQT